MRNRLAAAVLLGLLFTTSYAQDDGIELTSSALLDRAYTLSSTVPHEIRYSLLTRLTSAAVQNGVASGREWAQDLFVVSQQLSPGPGRDSAQVLALWAMSHWDRDGAFKMACQLEPPSSATLAVFTNHRSESIGGVFNRALSGSTVSLLEVQRCAQQLGDRGQYPYSAMLAVIHRAGREQRQAIFAQVVSYYGRSSPSPSNELDFIAFLNGANKEVPKHTADTAAGEMVRRMQRYAASNPPSSGELQVSTDKGVANISNPGDRIIWAALPTVAVIDPALADQLRASRPALNVSVLVNAKVRSETPYGYPRGEQQRRERQPARNRGDAIRWLLDDATADPQHAAPLAATIADPVVRASTLANLAAAQAEDATRSQALLQEAFDQLARIQNPRSLVWAASRVAEAAEKLHNPDIVVKCLDQGFAVARAHIAAERNSSLDTRRLLASNGYGAYFLASVGARVVPALTVQRVASLNDAATEAFLLVVIAEQLPRK